jgi:hypothetical protein
MVTSTPREDNEMGRTATGLRILFVSLAISLAVTTIVAVLTVLLGKPARIAQTPDFYAAMFGALGLIFGSSAAIGGAVATVRLAGAAVVISEDQRRRDVHDFLERRVDAVIEIFVGVLVAMAELFVEAVQLDARLREEITSNQVAAAKVGSPMSPEVRAAAKGLLVALANLRMNLQRVQRHTLAAQCFRAMLPKPDSSLVVLAGQLQAHGFSALESEISHTDITSLAQFIMSAEDRLATDEYTPYISASLAAAKANANDASLRIIVFAGDLVYALTGPSRTDVSKFVVASLGAAMLFDIYRSVPDEAELRRQVSLAYPELRTDVDRMPVSFRPADIAGENLDRAVAAIRARPETLFVVD